MYLKSLELAGFKSFPKKTALAFTAPITAIVGPNGSGKSNIAEAFRFVLGEQSIKSMRGKRAEDLIWSGSPHLARLNRASVKLIFDNRPQRRLNSSIPLSPSPEDGLAFSKGGEEGRLLNLDFDEAALERVVYRDSASEYLLNGSPVRLRDIVELLSGAHIGASGHHIISQGEADRILSANMKERREMIEDALGLKIYQWKRQESERKLERTEENMKQVEGLRKEIAPHLSFLKKQVEKVERAEVLKEELRILLTEYLQRESRYISKMRAALAEEERAPREELAKLDKALSANKKTLTDAAQENAGAGAVIALEEEERQLRARRETLLREVGRLEGEIAAGQKGGEGQKHKRSDEALVPLSEVEAVAREADAARPENLPAAFARITRALRALIERYKGGAAPLERAEREKRLIALAARKNSLENELLEIEKRERQLSVDEERIRAEWEKEKDSSREAEKEMFRILARGNELRGALSALSMRGGELERLEVDFKRELSEGAILAGRDVLDYEKAGLNGEAGKSADVQPLALEDRTKQEERRRRIEKLKIRLEDAGTAGGAEVVKEFRETTERDEFLSRELSDLASGAKTLRKLIEELEQRINEEFESGIGKINAEFQRFFSLMFGGGDARLSITRRERLPRREIDEVLLEEDPEIAAIAAEEEGEAGIEIEVNLPRKKIKGLMMLSGGERALTSIALLFAMSQVKPPPFIVLDETDAALDEANSKKYGDMIENLSKFSQLVLITHNRETMSRAGVIYGVTMDKSGVSKLLSIVFEEAALVAK